MNARRWRPGYGGAVSYLPSPGGGTPMDFSKLSLGDKVVAGSGIQFEDRGRHTLKGVPGVWRLYKVV